MFAPPPITPTYWSGHIHLHLSDKEEERLELVDFGHGSHLFALLLSRVLLPAEEFESHA